MHQELFMKIALRLLRPYRQPHLGSINGSHSKAVIASQTTLTVSFPILLQGVVATMVEEIMIDVLTLLRLQLIMVQ